MLPAVPCGWNLPQYHCQITSSPLDVFSNVNEEMITFACRWDVETEHPGFISLYFKFLHWVRRNVVLQAFLSVSGKRSAFSDAVQPTKGVIHRLQVPISSPCAQKVHEYTRFKVKGLTVSCLNLYGMSPNQNDAVR